MQRLFGANKMDDKSYNECMKRIKNLILFFKIHTLTNIYVYIMLNIDKSVGSSTSSLSNYQFAFTSCKLTHFKRSAPAGRFAF